MRKKPTLTQRLRYAFDNTLSRGPAALILWLVIVTAVLFAAAFLLDLIIGGVSQEAGLGPREIFWSILFQALVPNPPNNFESPWQFLEIMFGVTIAAIAQLAAFDAKYDPGAVREGFKPFTIPMERIKDVPVWAIHGADDMIVPLSAAQSTVDALKQAGGHVRFTILPNHDHDVWTDTYTNPEFYQWLLEHSNP